MSHERDEQEIPRESLVNPETVASAKKALLDLTVEMFTSREDFDRKKNARKIMDHGSINFSL